MFEQFVQFWNIVPFYLLLPYGAELLGAYMIQCYVLVLSRLIYMHLSVIIIIVIKDML